MCSTEVKQMQHKCDFQYGCMPRRGFHGVFI